MNLKLIYFKYSQGLEPVPEYIYSNLVNKIFHAKGTVMQIE